MDSFEWLRVENDNSTHDISCLHFKSRHLFLKARLRSSDQVKNFEASFFTSEAANWVHTPALPSEERIATMGVLWEERPLYAGERMIFCQFLSHLEPQRSPTRTIRLNWLYAHAR